MLKNKTYFVTGSSSGIGRAISKSLLQNGAKVIGLSRKKGEPEKKEPIWHSIWASTTFLVPERTL